MASLFSLLVLSVFLGAGFIIPTSGQSECTTGGQMPAAKNGTCDRYCNETKFEASVASGVLNYLFGNCNKQFPPNCVCPQLRDSNGNCITYSECACPKVNEVPVTSIIDGLYDCPCNYTNLFLNCELKFSGCKCKYDHYRLPNGTCVSGQEYCSGNPNY